MLQFTFTPFPTLETDRLILRAPDIHDDTAFIKLRTSDKVLTYLDRPKQTQEEIRELLKKVIAEVQENKSITWVITLKNARDMIGTIGFWRITPEHHRAEIGYMLLPEYWNTGLMSEAVQAVLDYGFSTMRLHSVEANVNPENTGSIRLLEKSGFVREAYFRENYYFNGRFLDSAVYSLLSGQPD